MAHGKKPIKEIAQAAGFTSDIHFIRVFKQYEGITPGAYRKFDK
ncbi:MAG: AraC family transcriptional regulator [Oscillospiraceae bacterium]